jgi:hypothetical protein
MGTARQPDHGAESAAAARCRVSRRSVRVYGAVLVNALVLVLRGVPIRGPVRRVRPRRGGWGADAPFLDCVGMLAGITSIVSQVKVCLKMAADSGSHLLLPRMPLRSAADLTAFNFLNGDAYMSYDDWFDADHLRAVMTDACPQMRILHPADLAEEKPGGRPGGDVKVRHRWSISCSSAPGYQKVQSYFWVGRPFAAWFEEEYRRLRYLSNLDAMAVGKWNSRSLSGGGGEPNRERASEAGDGGSAAPDDDDGGGEGITVVRIDSEFLLFRITDDPTGRDLALWNDLGHAIRFRADVRRVVRRVLDRLLLSPRSPLDPGYFYGVHFRVENDIIRSSLDDQLARDLDALNRAWERFGGADRATKKKPPVYLACGDAAQVETFVAAGARRGWDVTHKWKLAALDAGSSSSSSSPSPASGGAPRRNSPPSVVDGEDGDAAAVPTRALIDAVAFDFQGAVDMAVIVRARFFVGVTGSAFRRRWRTCATRRGGIGAARLMCGMMQARGVICSLRGIHSMRAVCEKIAVT